MSYIKRHINKGRGETVRGLFRSRKHRTVALHCAVTVAFALGVNLPGPASFPAAIAAADEVAVPEPQGYRRDKYRAPVPLTLKGATTVDEIAVEKLLETDKDLILIDVYPQAPKPPNLPKGTIWREPRHRTMDGAHWLPNIGYGVLSPENKAYFTTHLTALTGNNKEKPVLFFCLRDCWMSWNAAKRAVEWGYTRVYWFREGTDAWQEAGHELVRAKKVK